MLTQRSVSRLDRYQNWFGMRKKATLQIRERMCVCLAWRQKTLVVYKSSFFERIGNFYTVEIFVLLIKKNAMLRRELVRNTYFCMRVKKKIILSYSILKCLYLKVIFFFQRDMWIVVGVCVYMEKLYG